MRNRAVLQCDGLFHRRQHHCTLSHRAALTVSIGRFEDVMSGLDPRATVVFVMNQRLNMDYVLVTYLASKRSALSYAVGE